MFPLLAIETTDELCSAAIFTAEEKYSELNIKGKHVHSEKLLPMIEQLLIDNELEANELHCIAVSEGPGSFTGLRIGLAAAKGLAVGANLPILLVPTFEAFADKLKNYLSTGQKFVVARKASRDEIYFAKYEVTKENILNIIPLSLIDKNELDQHYESGDLIYSNENANLNVVTQSALDIGRWAYKFGKDLLTSNYDLLEPKYFKEFVVRK